MGSLERNYSGTPQRQRVAAWKHGDSRSPFRGRHGHHDGNAGAALKGRRRVPFAHAAESSPAPTRRSAAGSQTPGAVQKLPRDSTRRYEFTCGQEELAGGFKGPGKPIPASDDPLALLQLLLPDGLGPPCTLVRALNFANRGGWLQI